jgi:hypothetical protein
MMEYDKAIKVIPRRFGGEFPEAIPAGREKVAFKSLYRLLLYFQPRFHPAQVPTSLCTGIPEFGGISDAKRRICS